MTAATQPGALVAGRYRTKSELGRGGMGVVWLATDELLHRDVAIKETVWPAGLDDQERDTLRERAMREARTAARLDHPNVVRVFDVAEHDGRPWIVMQLVPYPSLRDVVRENGPLTPPQAAGIGLHILAAITAAHAAGVLHRDVKPANVLLGPDGHVVLTDFGLAVADGSSRVTTSGLLVGSPAYMSPERARGRPATLAADLWSLGATLYAAVEGRDPFERNGALAVLTAIATDEPDRAEHAGSLWPVISGLLRKDPARRPGTDQLERDLRRIAGDPRSGMSALPARLTVPLSVADLAAANRAPGPAARAAADTPALVPARPAEAAGGSSLPPPPELIPGFRPRPDSPASAPGVPAPVTTGQPARRRWIAPAAVLGLLAIAGISFGLAYSSAGSPGAQGAAAGQHAAARSPARHAPTAGPTPRPSASASPPASTTRPVTRTATTAGFVAYHDPSGFSIEIPAGWQVSHSGHLVYIQPPGGGVFLLIDQTKHPQPNALADWQQQEANRISTYPGYQRIRLVAVQYAQAEQAADWEFTYYDNGQLTHVLNRNVLVNKHQAYALYWSVPQAQWAADFHYFRVLAATFRPASRKQGSGHSGKGS
jgi:serine/threonine protein kinase